MNARLGKTQIFIGYEVVAAITAVLILDRTDRIICCILAAMLHELGHLLMMRLFHIPVHSVSVRLFDILIKADSPSDYRADIFVTLGGVMANFLCALIFMPLSRDLFYANLALGCFNLLPVLSLDGGHLFYLLLSRRFLPKTCAVILKITTFLFLLPLMTAGVLMLFRSGYNYSLLAISLYLLAVLILK